MDTSFKIVLQHVALERLVEVKRELAKRFNIDEDIASDIAGAAPIILLTDLSWEEAGIVRRRLGSLVDEGGRIVTTDAECDDIPKVNWPEPPRLAMVDAEEAKQAASSHGPPPYREVASFRVPGFPEELKIVVASAGAPPLAHLPHAPVHETSRAMPGRGPSLGVPPIEPVPIPAHVRHSGATSAAALTAQSAAATLAAAAVSAAATTAAAQAATVRADAALVAATQMPLSQALPAPVAVTSPPVATPVQAHPEPSPLMRAVEAERGNRASARLAALPPLPPAAAPAPAPAATPPAPSFASYAERAQPAPAPAPAPAPPPPPPPARQESATLRIEDSDLFEQPELPPVPASSSESSDDFGGFDIDEALRLLDNAPDAPAPAGAAAAPPPTFAPHAESAPRAQTRAGAPGDLSFGGAADSGVDFKEIESDVINLEAALERQPPPPERPTPPPPTRPTASGRAPAQAPPPPSRAPGRGSIAPLDPLEALSILESAKGPDSSDDVFSRTPSRPVSDDLEPLDPNEALAILQTSVPETSHRQGAGGRGTQIVASYPAKGAPVPPPPVRKTAERKALVDSGFDDSSDSIAVPPAPKGGVVDSSELDFDLAEPPPVPREPPAKGLPSKPSAGKTGTMKAVPGAAPAPQAPPGSRSAPPAPAGGGGARPSIRPATAPAREPDEDEPVHGLVLSKITGEGRRTKAAEIISELTRIPKDEAMKLTDRTIIPVLKGVSKADAESALKRFERSKISGRVTTRRLGE